MAHDLGLPIVRLVDGSGGGGSVKTLETERRAFVPFNPGWEWVVANLSRVPGRQPVPRLGRRARRGPGRDEPLLDDGQGHEPPVRRRARRREPARHRDGRQGVARRQQHPHPQRHGRRRGRDRGRGVRPRPPVPLVPAELGRRAAAARRDVDDDPERRDPALLDAIPRERRKVYKVRSIIEAVVDRGSFLEIGRGWGRSAVTGLARLDGWPVAVLANDPYHYAGGWTADASRKVERFVDLAETFRLPVVHLVDNPGFLIGTDGRAGRHDPPRRPRARRGVPGDRAVVLGAPAQGLRRRRRRAPERVAASRTGSRGRRASGDRSRSKAASRPRTAPSSKPPTTPPRCGPRSRPASPGPATRSRPRRRS